MISLQFELVKYPHSMPLASMEGVRYRDHGFQLEPGDTLFVYTSGVVEAQNEKNDLFGADRILEVLNRDPEATPSVLLQTVMSAVHRFSGEMPQADDLTMLSLKFYGTEDRQ